MATMAMRRSTAEVDALQNGLTVFLKDAPPTIDVSVLRAGLLMKNVRPSERIERAKGRGQKWADGATAENIAKLPERQMMALLWYYWGGLSRSGVANEMDIAPGTVDALLSQAKKFLLDCLTKSKESRRYQ